MDSTNPAAAKSRVSKSRLSRYLPPLPASIRGRLHHVHATVNLNGLAVDVARGIRAQEENGVGDLFIGSQCSSRRLGYDRIQNLARRELDVKIVVHRTGRNRVYANAFRGQ